MTPPSHISLGPFGKLQLPGASGATGPIPGADLAAGVPRYLLTAAGGAHERGPLEYFERPSPDWNELTAQAARLRQHVRGTLPSFSSVQAKTAENLAMFGGLAAVFIFSAVMLMLDEQESLLLRLGRTALALTVGGGLIAAAILMYRAKKRLRIEFGRLTQRLGTPPLEGRAAGFAELDWLDEHRWGQAPFLGCSDETGSFRMAARCHCHGAPALITLAHSAAGSGDGVAEQNLTSVFVARPGLAGRRLHPEIAQLAQQRRFFVDVSPAGIRASRDDTTCEAIAASEELVEALARPAALYAADTGPAIGGGIQGMA